jgi:hypothetical protein
MQPANPPTHTEDLNRTRLAMHRIYTRWAEQGASVLAAEAAQELEAKKSPTTDGNQVGLNLEETNCDDGTSQLAS